MLAPVAARRPDRLPALRDLVRDRHELIGELAHLSVPDLKEAEGGLRDATVLKALVATWLVDVPHVELERTRLALLDVRDVLQGTRRPRDRPDRPRDVERPRAPARPRRRPRRAGPRPRARPPDHPPVPPDLAPGRRRARPAGVVPRGPPARPDPARARRRAGRRRGGARRAGPPGGGPAAAAPRRRGGRRARRRPRPADRGPAGPRVRRRCRCRGRTRPASCWSGCSPPGAACSGCGRRSRRPARSSAFLPEWERIRLLPHASAIHRFTVDRHVVETCIEASALIRDVARPDVLMVAALLHDIGKGSLTEHSVAGEPIARDDRRRGWASRPTRST